MPRSLNGEIKTALLSTVICYVEVSFKADLTIHFL